MSEFTWLDEYKIGHETIDNQHQFLFELANRIVEDSDTEALTEHAMLLYRHIREHFHAEETLMKQYGYPGYDEHVQAHNQMLDKLVEISNSIHDGTWNPNDVLTFMRGWVLVHIMEVDMVMGDFLRQHINP